MRRFSQLALFVLAIALGLATALAFNWSALGHGLFSALSSIFLSIGVFISFYKMKIDIDSDTLSVTINVVVSIVVKFTVCFGVIYLVSRNIELAIIAGLTSQIDPIYVSYTSRFGSKADRLRPLVDILKFWSALDAVVVVSAITLIISANQEVLGGYRGASQSLVFWNVVFVLVTTIMLFLLRELEREGVMVLKRWLPVDLFAIGTSIIGGWVVTSALGGAFTKSTYPPRLMRRAAGILFPASAFLIGLYAGAFDELSMQDFWLGLTIAAVVFASQSVAAMLVWQGLPRAQRVQLALSQQGGLTTVSSLVVAGGAFTEHLFAAIVALVTMNALFVLGQLVGTEIGPTDTDNGTVSR